MTRQELFTWIRQQYGTEPEYPWHDWNAVLRHNDNNKWYGVVLEVSADKLGLPEAGIIDVLNVKSDPLLIGSLRGQDGYFPAYHMNKEKWLSIQLGKPELDDAIKDLLSLSYELTAPKKRKPKSSAKNPGDFANGNAVQQITLILGGCIIIDSEPFADSTELVKHFNSSRGHSFDFNIHKNSFS